MTALLMVNAVEGRRPTVEESAQQLGLPLERLDVEYGVNVIDPENGLYAVRAVGDAQDLGQAFSDPFIGVFGR